MHKTILRIAAVMAVLTLLLLPLGSLAAPVETPVPSNSPMPSASSKPTTAMTKSEKLIRELLAETSTAKQQKQFLSLIKPRLKHATVRSLYGRTDKWLAFVDIYQTYKNGRASGLFIQQANVQYGVLGIPPNPISCMLTVGNYTYSINSSAKAIYLFPTEALPKNSLSADISVIITDESGSELSIALTQSLPGDVLEIESAISEMATAYIDYAKTQDEIIPIDHAYMRLRSHVVNTQTMQMSYTWELWLLHDSTLPSPATYLYYNVQNGKVTVHKTEVKR